MRSKNPCCSASNLSSLSSTLLLSLCFATLAACGPKNSVEDNEPPTGPVRTDTRSRLTGGSAGETSSSVSYCRSPLDMGTVVDSRRPALVQTVLTSLIDSRCSTYQEFRVTLKTRQRITLVGKFACRNGVQISEQICTGLTRDILSTQKNAVTVPVVADESWHPSDIDATIEFF